MFTLYFSLVFFNTEIYRIADYFANKSGNGRSGFEFVVGLVCGCVWHGVQSVSVLVCALGSHMVRSASAHDADGTLIMHGRARHHARTHSASYTDALGTLCRCAGHRWLAATARLTVAAGQSFLSAEKIWRFRK